MGWADSRELIFDQRRGSGCVLSVPWGWVGVSEGTGHSISIQHTRVSFGGISR